MINHQGVRKIDRLSNWFIDPYKGRLIDLLIDWLIYSKVDWLIDWQREWLCGLNMNCLVLICFFLLFLDDTNIYFFPSVPVGRLHGSGVVREPAAVLLQWFSRHFPLRHPRDHIVAHVLVFRQSPAHLVLWRPEVGHACHGTCKLFFPLIFPLWFGAASRGRFFLSVFIYWIFLVEDCLRAIFRSWLCGLLACRSANQFNAGISGYGVFHLLLRLWSTLGHEWHPQ